LVREERSDATQSVGANLVGGFGETMGDAWRTELRWASLRSERSFPIPEKGAPQTRLTAAFALQPEFRLLGDRLALSPGARWEAFFDRFSELPAYGNYPLPQGPSRYGETWAGTYQLNLRLALSGAVLLKADVGEYERVPTLLERFGNRGTVIGNPALRSEQGTNRDLGFVVNHYPSASRLSVSVFHNDSSDLISFVRNSQRTATAQNIGAAEVKGLELDLGVGAAGPLGLGLRGTWMETVDRSDNAAFRGQPLPGRPGYEILGRINGGQAHWRVGYEITAMGDNTLDRHGLQKVPERLLHEVWASVALAGVVLDARVENLLDNEELYDLYGWPLPGRRFQLSLRTGGDLGI
jgi:iron complex outermembrane receptor protein